MSEGRYGGWDPNDREDRYDNSGHVEYTGSNRPVQGTQERRDGDRIRRGGGDGFRDFFYWFFSNGGFRTLPRIIAVIAVIVGVILIIANRDALLNGVQGFIAGLLPIIVVVLLLWRLIRSFFNPK